MSEDVCSIFHNSDACRLLLESNKTRLHIKDTFVKAQVTTSNSSHPDCYTNTERSNKSLNEDDIPWCDVFLYDNVKEPYLQNSGLETIAAFDMACLENCSCVLGFRKFTSTCGHGQNKILSETLLIYPRDIEILLFSYTGLNDISEGAFFGLDALTHLYLDRNQIFSISRDTFAGLEELIYLDLNYNEIVNLRNDTFMLLPHLKVLSVRVNGLKSLEFGVFSQLTHLQQLYLSWNNLEKLPEMCFSRLYELTYLELKFNSIDLLSPNSFYNLYQLQDVHLQFNQITQIPVGLFEGLSELRALYLHSNRLISIPAGLFNGLNKLQYLSLSDNELSTLPDAIFDDLNFLILLHLNNNLLTTLSSNVFTYLSKLTLLFIEDNRLYSLPPILFLQTNLLYELNLRNNQIVSLPKSIFHTLERIENLYINQNNLNTLPENIFDNMTSLRFLDISHNILRNISNNLFLEITGIVFLNMSHNNILAFPTLESLARLQIVDLSFNEVSLLDPHMFGSKPELIFLSLDHNNIIELPVELLYGMPNAQVLNLQVNQVQELIYKAFKNQGKLTTLNIEHNHLSYVGRDSFFGLHKLHNLYCQENKILNLDKDTFAYLTEIQFINLSQNDISRIDDNVFHTDADIATLDLRSNNLRFVREDFFERLKESTILVDESSTCCFTANANCISESPRLVYLTCKRMLDGSLLQISMWTLGFFAIICNAVVFVLRCLETRSIRVQTLLILSLALSDFLMGVNMIILAAADAYYQDYFPSFSNTWRAGILCKLASILSVLSSEVSVFLITLISFDRFLGVKYPFSIFRLTPTSAKVCLAVIWLFGLTISITPVVLSGIYSDILEVSEVCVGVPIVKRPISVTKSNLVEIVTNDVQVASSLVVNNVKGIYEQVFRVKYKEKSTLSNYFVSQVVGEELATYFSITLFIGVNFTCFCLVAIMYLIIFKTAKESARNTGRKQHELDEIRMALRMSAVVLTDFCTWVPLILVCILVQADVIMVDPVVYSWTVAFIIPINSAINPFLYTIISLLQKKVK